MTQVKKALDQWQTKVLRLGSSDEAYDKGFRDEDRQDRQVANKVLKFSKPLFTEKKLRKKPRKSVNKTVDEGIEKGGGSVG